MTALVLSTAGLAMAKSEKTNVVFFLVDDLGWTDVGCFGSSFYETPNIDRLCKSGVKFTNAYAACQVCSPSRISIMTGKYPARLDTTDYFGAPQPERAKNSKWYKHPLLPAKYLEELPLEETTLAEAFKSNGYKTFFAGKWHLGHSPKFWTENQGFDINQGGWSRGGPYGGKKYFSPYGNPRLSNGPDGEHLPDRLATETAKFIGENKDQPFFAYLSFYSVHTPLIGRADLIKKYKQKKKLQNLQAKWGKEGGRSVREVQEHAVYAAMVEAMDQAVGKVLKALEVNGLVENTVVVFTSDNGGLSTSEGHPTSNLPIRGGKGWMYEGGVRVPLIVRHPNNQKMAGKTCEDVVIGTDYYPTLLELAGLNAMPNQCLDGKSIVPSLSGKKVKERDVYWHYPHYGNQGGSPATAIRSGKWKLIKFHGTDKLELYNLEADLEEQRELAKKNPEITRALEVKIEAWKKEVGAKMPTPNLKNKK